MNPEPGARFRILLVEDDPDFAALVHHVLIHQLPDGCTVDVAGLLRSGLERAVAIPYDAVLLDLNLPDSRGLHTFTRFHEEAAEAVLIVLTAQEDESLGLEAVRAGAEEYLLKSDLRPLSLARQVRYAVERARRKHNLAQPARTPRICSFFSCHGGAGGTTLTLNTAAAIAASHRSVVAAELTPEFGAFAAQLGVAAPPGPPPETATDNEPGGLCSSLLPLPWGVRVLFGPQLPEHYRERSPEQTAGLVHALSRLFEVTLIDAGGGARAACPVLRLSTAVVLVAERAPASLTAARAAAAFLRSAGVPDCLCAVAVVTRAGLSASTPALDISRAAGYPLLAVVPSAAEELHTCSGIPLVVAQPALPFSEAIRNLAATLLADPVEAVLSGLASLRH